MGLGPRAGEALQGQGPRGPALDVSPDAAQGLINGPSFAAAVGLGDRLRSPDLMAQVAAGPGVTVAEHAAELQNVTEDDSPEGRLLLQLNTPMSQHTMSGSVAGRAEMIQAVEREGWTPARWSVAHDAKGRPRAYPLFRRVG